MATGESGRPLERHAPQYTRRLSSSRSAGGCIAERSGIRRLRPRTSLAPRPVGASVHRSQRNPSRSRAAASDSQHQHIKRSRNARRLARSFGRADRHRRGRRRSTKPGGRTNAMAGSAMPGWLFEDVRCRGTRTPYPKIDSKPPEHLRSQAARLHRPFRRDTAQCGLQACLAPSANVLLM